MKKQIKTAWDFKLFYKNDTDPKIKADLEFFEKAIDAFELKYKNKTDYLNDSKKLLKICQDYEALIAMPENCKPTHYFNLRKDIDTNNKIAQAKISELSEKYSKFNNKILFFKLNLGKISKEQQAVFLKDKSLEKFHYFLKNLFERAKYKLSEPEEKILNLLSKPAQGMWVSGFAKVLSNQEVKFKGKNIPINQAFGMIPELKTKERRVLADIINQKLIDISDFAEAEINAVVSKKKITDELRGYEKAYSSTVKNYENDDETVENLVDVVTKGFKISHRFYKIKAKLLKENRLAYTDRMAKIGDSRKKFSFEDSVEIASSAFAKFDPKYREIFESYLIKGQIDVYPKKGKKGGAYCWGSYGLPTVVLLNHSNTFDSIKTLGHEMGHAFHTEMSHGQTPIYADYTTSVAEVASTLFENFIFEEVFEKLSAQEKIIALHNKINDSVSTVFRQIACFNFEKELHEQIRNKGYVAKEEIAKILNKHMKNYLGPIFDLKDEDGYFFVSWPHIRRFFYVYTYASGLLISDALYAEYKKDKNFKEKIEQFLKAGSTKCPEDIFADIGIDIRNPEFFKKGLKVIEDNVKKLEKLVNGK
jgi:oligoendopeptidase F